MNKSQNNLLDSKKVLEQEFDVNSFFFANDLKNTANNEFETDSNHAIIFVRGNGGKVSQYKVEIDEESGNLEDVQKGYCNLINLYSCNFNFKSEENLENFRVPVVDFRIVLPKNKVQKVKQQKDNECFKFKFKPQSKKEQSEEAINTKSSGNQREGLNIKKQLKSRVVFDDGVNDFVTRIDKNYLDFINLKSEDIRVDNVYFSSAPGHRILVNGYLNDKNSLITSIDHPDKASIDEKIKQAEENQRHRLLGQSQKEQHNRLSESFFTGAKAAGITILSELGLFTVTGGVLGIGYLISPDLAANVLGFGVDVCESIGLDSGLKIASTLGGIGLGVALSMGAGVTVYSYFNFNSRNDGNNPPNLSIQERG